MGEFNSADHCIYYCRQEFLRKNEIALIVSKRGLKCSTWCNLKNDKMILASFQGKPFSITVFQVYTQATDAKEDWFYEDL